jgi:ABC-type transport system substrate-binding protein
VTSEALRFSIERALSPKLATDPPAMHFLGDLVGAKEYHAGRAGHVRGIHVSGARATISFTLTKPARDFLERISLPFFCALPVGTPIPEGGLANPAPSAAPYYVSDSFNGEYLILKRNPNYTGRPKAKLDAIAFRLGISSEHAVARIRSGESDGAILFDQVLAPGGVVAREARASGGKYRTEELAVRGITYPGEKGFLHGLFSSHLGCDTIDYTFDLTTLCIRER